MRKFFDPPEVCVRVFVSLMEASMQMIRFATFAALAAVLMGAPGANALSIDDKSMNNANGSARFDDPDEQMPIQVLKPGAHFGGSGAASDSSDPASVRYDYDPSSGSYIPHRQ